jgi:Arrestin (or S-antigen), N-terminal domain
LLEDDVSVSLLRTRFAGKVTTSGPDQKTNYLFRELEEFIGEQTTLEGREHVFPFTFRVPPTTLPPSFVSAFGSVVYEMEACALQPGYPKLTTIIPVTIPTTLDATAERYSAEVVESNQGQVGLPSIFTRVRSFLKLPSSSTYTATVTIPRMAYACEGITV